MKKLKKYIHKIVKNKLDSEVKNITLIEEGVEAHTFAVTLKNNERIIIQFPFRHPTVNYNKVVMISEKLRKKNLPVAKVLLVDNSKKLVPTKYKIETYLPGTIINFEKLNKQEQKKIIFQIAHIFSKIHSIKMKNFGTGRSHKNNIINRWDLYIKRRIGIIHKEIKRIKLLPENQINKCFTLLEKNKDCLKCKYPKLIHADFGFHNLLFQKNKLTGIVDLKPSGGGDPYYDIAYFFVMSRTAMNHLDTLQRIYGKLNLRKLNFYRVFVALQKILYRNKYNHKELSRTKKLFREALEDLKNISS